MEFRGEGPGPRTRDGCSVELYRRLPAAGEIEKLEAWIVGREILELGCGAGRLTRRLLERGFEVTAVDNSPEMLAHVPREARAIEGDLETLDLGRTFDTVLLASTLINVPDATERAAILASCHRHLATHGALLLERHDPELLATISTGRSSTIGDVEILVERIERAPGLVEMSLRYRSGGDEWRHHFAAEPLDDSQVAGCLAEAGFAPPEWIDRRWARARRAP